MHKTLRDFKIQADPLISATRPDLVLFNKKKKKKKENLVSSGFCHHSRAQNNNNLNIYNEIFQRNSLSLLLFHVV